MAENETSEPVEEPKKSGLLGKLMVPVIVGLVSAGLGFSVPLVMPGVLGDDSDAGEQVAADPIFVPFGQVVVNLNEGRMNRYLQLGITIQTTGDAMVQQELTEAVEKKKAILQNWLLAYLADMSMDDIRGAAGQNRLRREIHDQFSRVLYPNGEGEIEDILFEEFNIQ